MDKENKTKTEEEILEEKITEEFMKLVFIVREWFEKENMLDEGDPLVDFVIGRFAKRIQELLIDERNK